jgi:hypothetical protein
MGVVRPMAGVTIDEQLVELCTDLEKSTKELTDDYKSKVLAWIEKYGAFASSKNLAHAINIIEQKFGVRPQTGVVDTTPEPMVDPVFPTTGWLGEYMDYTGSHEAPDLFHFWVGVSVICGAIRRNVYFEQGYYRVYPNIYCILVAPPGVCKKSTAANIGVDILQELPNLNLIREKATPESLVKAMMDGMAAQPVSSDGLVMEASASAFVFAPELAVFLGRETYNEGLIGILTTLFDCHNRWESMTVGRGRSLLHNIHLCMLGATTPDLMSRVIPQSAFGGGFLSRIIFAVKNNTPRCVPFPKLRDQLTRERLSAELLRISETRGQIVQSKEGEAWAIDWYTKHHKRLQAQEDLTLSGYLERKQDHMIKLCIVLLLSSGGDLILTPELYSQALSILNYTERTMGGAFTSIQTTDVGKDHDRILKMMENNGGRMEHSRLLRRVYGHMDAQGFRRSVATLKEAGFIEEILGPKNHEYILLRRR